MVILTAIDGEQVPSPPVTVGDELARQFDEELVVMHVMPRDQFEKVHGATTDPEAASSIQETMMPYDTESVPSGGPTSYSIKDGEERAAGVAREVVKETLGELHNITFQGRVGTPAEEILIEAEQREAHYLVMGPRRRTPFKQAVFGSTTQAVLLEADRPVVTVPREK